jgi:uncharacterized protein YjiS (DUF1127 family)
MSTTCTAAAEGDRARSRGRALVATVKTWWMACLTRRIERLAILQLEAMSDRELEDIGLTRSQIEAGERRSSAAAKSSSPTTGQGDEMGSLRCASSMDLCPSPVMRRLILDVALDASAPNRPITTRTRATTLALCRRE